MRRALFLDRDGTVIEDVGYPRDPAQVRLLPGAADALRALQQQGFMLIIVSNQSGIGRGLVTGDEAHRVHARFVTELAKYGVRLDGAYYCPHSPEEGCSCRKPATGLFRQAAEELGLDLTQSITLGDKLSDVEAGKRAGCCTVLFGTDAMAAGSETTPNVAARDWPAVLKWILSEESATA